MTEFDFSDETQLHLEWTLDTFEDALRLLWERGEHDYEEEALSKTWKSLKPVIEDAFKKARLYDSSQPKVINDE